MHCNKNECIAMKLNLSFHALQSKHLAGACQSSNIEWCKPSECNDLCNWETAN